MQRNQLQTLTQNSIIRVLLHAVFWITYLFISAATIKQFYPDESLSHLMLRISLTLPVDMAASYFTAYWLVPKFLYQKRFVAFSLILAATAVVFILIQRLIIYKITYPLVLQIEPASPFFMMNWFYSFTNIYFIVFVLVGIKLVQRNMREEKNIRELSQQKTEAELKFLKAQVHPHFLFNTLNNLYALTLEKSPKSSEVVLRLSDLMNYMLYECNADTILLNKEIKLLENYLELEQIRYEKSLLVHFDKTGEITGKRIAPMILLPFIENAFKHGVSKISKAPEVKIRITVDGQVLHFSIENSKPEEIQQDISGYTEGIGLQNVEKRLALIYPGRHKLRIQNQDKKFTVELKLEMQ